MVSSGQIYVKNLVLNEIIKNYFICRCNSNWCFPSSSKETNELLRQCLDVPQTEINTDLDEIIKKSNEFPIKFPIETVRFVMFLLYAFWHYNEKIPEFRSY